MAKTSISLIKANLEVLTAVARQGWVLNGKAYTAEVMPLFYQITQGWYEYVLLIGDEEACVLKAHDDIAAISGFHSLFILKDPLTWTILHRTVSFRSVEENPE